VAQVVAVMVSEEKKILLITARMLQLILVLVVAVLEQVLVSLVDKVVMVVQALLSFAINFNRRGI
jgi:hypothetical protein